MEQALTLLSKPWSDSTCMRCLTTVHSLFKEATALPDPKPSDVI